MTAALAGVRRAQILAKISTGGLLGHVTAPIYALGRCFRA